MAQTDPPSLVTDPAPRIKNLGKAFGKGDETDGSGGMGITSNTGVIPVTTIPATWANAVIGADAYQLQTDVELGVRKWEHRSDYQFPTPSTKVEVCGSRCVRMLRSPTGAAHTLPYLSSLIGFAGTSTIGPKLLRLTVPLTVPAVSSLTLKLTNYQSSTASIVFGGTWGRSALKVVMTDSLMSNGAARALSPIFTLGFDAGSELDFDLSSGLTGSRLYYLWFFLEEYHGNTGADSTNYYSETENFDVGLVWS
jgi:hypothetical protein